MYKIWFSRSPYNVLSTYSKQFNTLSELANYIHLHVPRHPIMYPKIFQQLSIREEYIVRRKLLSLDKKRYLSMKVLKYRVIYNVVGEWVEAARSFAIFSESTVVEARTPREAVQILEDRWKAKGYDCCRIIGVQLIV